MTEELLAAAIQDAKEAEAYASELEVQIKALVKALEATEGRIEQAANDFHDASRWADAPHFMSDCTVMDWVTAPARAALAAAKEPT